MPPPRRKALPFLGFPGGRRLGYRLVDNGFLNGLQDIIRAAVPDGVAYEFEVVMPADNNEFDIRVIL